MSQHQPRRGSDVEAFIKAERDKYEAAEHFGPDVRRDAAYFALDELLDLYRLKADLGYLLGQVTETPGPPE